MTLGNWVLAFFCTINKLNNYPTDITIPLFKTVYAVF